MELENALQVASEEYRLDPDYRSCVLPLLRAPEGPWPRCCGGGCDPCAQTLIAVAERALELMGSKSGGT